MFRKIAKLIGLNVESHWSFIVMDNRVFIPFTIVNEIRNLEVDSFPQDCQNLIESLKLKIPENDRWDFDYPQYSFSSVKE